MPIDINYELIAGGNRLACDYVTDFSRLSTFFPGDPRHDDAYREVIKALEKRDYERESLCASLKARNASWGCPQATLENIAKLGNPGCFAVTTGQQVGLFGGPLYTLYKAVTAIRLAEDLEKKLDKPFVPLFWMESEDHDLLEATEIKIVDRAYDIQSLRYEPLHVEEGMPLSALVVDENSQALLQRLNEITSPSVFKDAILSLLQASFSPGKLYADAFARWLLSLLGARGLIIVPPSDLTLKRLATSLFLQELDLSPRSSQILAATSEELAKRGYHGQIKVKEGRVNLFYHNPGRRPLFLRDGLLFTEPDSGVMSIEEIRELVKAHPERFSPNVALRPLLQDHLLPTAVYVGGPGEVSYWAQIGGLYQLFKIVEPLVYPRMTITLCESKVRKALEKFSITYEDFFHERGSLVRKRMERLLPPHLSERMEGGWMGMKAQIDDLEKEAAALDVNLEPLFRRTAGKMQQMWDSLARKVREAYLQKDELLQDQAKKVENSFFPHGELQERALGSMSFYLKYGEALVDELFRVPVISPPWRHQIIEL
jgi:bacillithiol synthase